MRQTRRQREITTKRIIEETVGRDAAKENVKMERDESERVCVYIRVHVCTVEGRVPKVREGWKRNFAA